MFNLQQAPDADDIVPVPNQIPWYYLTLAILVGAAMLTHGITMIAKGWEQELKLPAWFSVAAQVFAIVLSTCLGCLAGYIIWEWALGGMVALVGAFSSTLVLAFVRAKIDSTKDAAKNVIDNAKQQ